jgi:hypothetical protein
MPITLNHSNIGVQYSSDKSYIIETVKSDLYRKNEIIDTIVRDNLQTAPVTPSIYIENGNNGSNIYAIESYTYSGSANTADFTRVFTKSTTCDILIVGGGGGGGRAHAGGGGAGSLIYVTNVLLNAGTYNINVGKGGAGATARDGVAGGGPNNGSDTSIVYNSTNIYLAKGGGGGKSATGQGASGGSGGGADGAFAGGAALTTNIPSGSYGNSGGSGLSSGNDNAWSGGGGGGANSAGGSATLTTGVIRAGNGGDGKLINITGTNTYYAGGGGGGCMFTFNNIAGLGGLGNGGNGGSGTDGTNALNNTGSGGGGGGFAYNPSTDYSGGNGGSGIVIIRYLLGTIPTTNFLTTEPTVSSPAFTESIQSFLHSGGAENQTTHTITVGRDTICDILIVGGGGAGGNSMGGGGGAGGVVYTVNQTINAGTYTINVGKGGTGLALIGNNEQGTAGVNQDGKDSFIQLNGTDVSLPMGSANQSLRGKGGGGGGVYYDPAFVNGRNGGSGGGCSEFNPNFAVNTPGSATQGNTLWNGTSYVAGGKAGRANTTTLNDLNAGGGGGAGNNGGSYKDGNAGVQINITGISQFYAAGGGAGQYSLQNSLGEGIGGSGIGGTGRIRGSDSQGYLREATSGTNGTGSGGGGGAYSQDPDLPVGSGGSGIVIIKFKSLVGFGIVLEGNPITHKRLNFAFDSLGFSFDTTKYVEYQAQQKTGVGGWRIVRYLPPNIGRWYSGNNFTSTSVNSTNIGTAYNYTNEWGVPFGTFDEMFFGTFDMTYWLRCLKTSVLGTYTNDLRPIISSSTSSTPYSVRWYNADSELVQPWISVNDHNTGAAALILYGENSDTRLSDLRNAYGGMCVLVRDSTTSITIPNMRIYPLNFQVPTLADINNNSNVILRGAYDIALSTSNAVIIPKSNQYIPPPTTFTNYSIERMYPPVRNFTTDTTIVSGQTYGNGTYVVSASSYFNPSPLESPYYIFNNTSTGWTTLTQYGANGQYSGGFSLGGYSGEWIKVKFPTRIKMTRYILQHGQYEVSRSPSVYKIFGSNDDVSWVEIVNKSIPLIAANYVNNMFEESVNYDNYYNYYALVVNKVLGQVWLTVGEWYIYGQEVLPSSLSLRYNLLNPVIDPIGAQWTYSSNNTNVYHMGRVGICTTSPEYPLDVRGTIYSSTGGYTSSTLTKWSVLSDRRIKENIVKASYDKCLENVKNIELYNFNFKDNCVNTNDRHQLGFIAQEVQQVYPKAVEVGKMIVNLEQKIDDLLTLNITQIDYTLYGAVKSLIEKIENIKIKMEHIKTTYDIS